MDTDKSTGDNSNDISTDYANSLKAKNNNVVTSKHMRGRSNSRSSDDLGKN